MFAGWFPQVPALPFPHPAPVRDAAARALLPRLGAAAGLLTPPDRLWEALLDQTGSYLH